MRIAKPILLVTTPLGVAQGIYECFEWAGGLAFIMVAMVAVLSAAVGSLILTIRREQRSGR